MRKVLHILLLFTALLPLGAYVSPPETTVNISGSCFDAPVTLTLYGSPIDGKSAWTGTATIAGVPNTPVALYWDSALGVWILSFDGQPFFTYSGDTPLPPNNSTGVWSQVEGTTALCPASTPVSISGTGTQNPPAVVVLSAPTVTNVNCRGASTGQISVTASGGTAPYTYTLNPGGTQNTTGTFTGLPAGDYTVSVVDANNNSATSGTISLMQPATDLALSTPTVTNVSCSGPSTGQIIISASGGTSPYTYTLNPGNVQNTTGSFSGLSSGDYTVSVVDSKGCTTGSGTIAVAPASTLSLSTPTVTDVKCNGTSTGEISMTASGGTAPYTYTLSPGNTQNNTGTFTGLPAGDYTVSVVDANGCSATSSTIEVEQTPKLTIKTGGNKSVFAGFGSTCTTLSATAHGGTKGDYTYTWMPGNLSGQSVEVCQSETTIYTVTVTDGNNCTASAEVTVIVADVRCGNKNDKVLVCHNGKEMCLTPNAVAGHLDHGDKLGSCPTGTNARIGFETSESVPFQLALRAYPNPTTHMVKVEIQSQVAGPVQLDLLDMLGRPVTQQTEQLREGLNEITVNLGAQATGVYLLRCRDPLGRQAVLKVSKN